MWHETRGVSCLCFVKCAETKCSLLTSLHFIQVFWDGGSWPRAATCALPWPAAPPCTLHMHEPRAGPAGRLCKAAPALTGSHFINSLSSSCSFKCSIITNKAVTLCLQLYNLAKCRYDLGFKEEREVTSRGRRGTRGGGKSWGSSRPSSAQLRRQGRGWMANQRANLQ